VSALWRLKMRISAYGAGRACWQPVKMTNHRRGQAIGRAGGARQYHQ
jgi:hypothetical protein